MHFTTCKQDNIQTLQAEFLTHPLLRQMSSQSSSSWVLEDSSSSNTLNSISMSSSIDAQQLPPLPQGCGEKFAVTQEDHLYTYVRASVPFPYDVKLLGFKNKKPEDNFYFYNPSIIGAPDNSMYYMAIRESGIHHCPEIRNITSTVTQVAFGVSENPRGPAKYCTTFYENSTQKGFNGPEDPRFMYIAPPGSNGTKILHMMTLNDRKVSLHQVHFSITKKGCSTNVTNSLQMWLNETVKQKMQKNWMFIPDSTTADGEPLFAYKLNPLEVLGINMTTGEGTIVSSQPKLSCVPNIRGNTMFLRHPTQSNVFFGIAHEQFLKRRYTSRVISIEEYEPHHFKMTGMSDWFGIPSRSGDICVNRIHFPASMMYTDNNKETIVIGMGYMDCTAHSVQVRTRDIISSIKPLSCS